MKTLAIVTLALVIASCSGTKSAKQPTAQLENTYWKLVELNGQPVAPPSGSSKQYFIELKSSDNSISAFAGCNGIGGNYEMKEGNRIKFSKLISTMMACPELPTEDAFKKVLETVDNYAISGQVLSLNRARMAALAKFEVSTR